MSHISFYSQKLTNIFLPDKLTVT